MLNANTNERAYHRANVRWLPCVNASGETIPAGAVVKVGAMNDDGMYEVSKPTQNSYPYGIGFNDVSDIPATNTGQFTMEFPNWALFESEGSGSGYAEIVGPKANEWALFASETGFRVLRFDEDNSFVNVIIDPFAVSDESSGSGSGSGEDCENTNEVTFRECDPTTGAQTDVTITFPNGIRVCRTPVGSGG